MSILPVFADSSNNSVGVDVIPDREDERKIIEYFKRPTTINGGHVRAGSVAYERFAETYSTTSLGNYLTIIKKEGDTYKVIFGIPSYLSEGISDKKGSLGSITTEVITYGNVTYTISEEDFEIVKIER